MKSNKIWKIISDIFFYVVLIGLLSICFVMITSAKQGKQPSIMGHKFYTVLTGSMEPTINVGDLVIVKETSPEDIQQGDIITFGSESSDNITTHRVKEIISENNEMQFVTQGDANNVQDPMPIKSKVLVGKVTKIIPKIGAIMAWMKSNLVLIIGVISITIVFISIVSRLKRKLIKSV